MASEPPFYHCAPREARESIAVNGLWPGRDGLVWLWETEEAARAYALWADDVWEVDARLPVVPSGRHHGELVCPVAVPARLLKRL